MERWKVEMELLRHSYALEYGKEKRGIKQN
jgi:hypothetical protein